MQMYQVDLYRKNPETDNSEGNPTSARRWKSQITKSQITNKFQFSNVKASPVLVIWILFAVWRIRYCLEFDICNLVLPLRGSGGMPLETERQPSVYQRMKLQSNAYSNMRYHAWDRLVSICCRRECLREVVPSTRGPGWTNLWSIGFATRWIAE